MLLPDLDSDLSIKMDKEHNKQKRISPTTTAAIGALLTLIGGFFLFYNYTESKKIVAYDYMSNAYYNSVDVVEVETNEISEEEDTNRPIEDKELSGEVTNHYIGYLTIPKLNFTKGFLDYRSEDNTVEKNIMVVEGSNYPDVERGNLMIAGHSGTGWKAFFNELYRLQIGDILNVDYKGKKYNYTIHNIYKQPKTGKLAIYRDYNKTTLTLITCTNNDSTTQTIYIAELTNIEE